MNPVRFDDVLDFWFGPPGSATRGLARAEWFRKDDAFDAAIRARFLGCHEAAAEERLSAWEATPYAALALVIVLDQFPRNMFRGHARAFAGDAQALAVARRLVDRGFDRFYQAVERPFAYLPFEHAEDLAAQRRSLALFDTLAGVPGSATSIDYARRHYEIVSRFGRFPHRNAILGRPSTAEELEFLKQPGSGF
jgi:uncharacterized protein (DUF924 family)